MSKQGDYWKTRFIQLEDAEHNKSVELMKQIEAECFKAEQELTKRINEWYARIAVNNDISLSEAKKLLKDNELAEFKWTVEEYIKRGEENALNNKWVKELENASAKVHISRLEQIKLETRQICEELYQSRIEQISEHIGDVYKDTYYNTIFELQKAYEVSSSFSKIDKDKLEKIISKPWAADGRNFSERIWSSKGQLINEVHTALTQMCALGQGPDKAIKHISKSMNVSKSQAANLVMTESAFFSTASQKSAYKDLEVEEYENVATLDKRTSDVCREMDGTHYKVSDMEPGVNAPPFHCRCRTTTCPYFEDDNDGQRAARGSDGKTYLVPADMKYKDWKNSLTEGENGKLIFDKKGNIKGTTLQGTSSNDKIKKKDSKNTYIDMDLQYFSMDSKDYPTIHLDKDEYAHVVSELNTHMTEEQRNKKIVRKAIGEYIYTVENNGFNDYRVIDKELIDSDFEEWWRD